MISTKLRYLILLVATVSTLPLKAASQVWITPSTASTGTIPTYSEDPFGFLKYLVAPTVPYKQLYQTPLGTKFYFVGSTNDAVYVYNSDLSSQSKSFPLGFNSPGAAMTPDGRRFLVISGGLRIFDTTTDQEIGPTGGVNVGSTPSAVAASLDSKLAFVLDQNNRRLLAVDLSLNTVVGTPLMIGANPLSVSVGPNGLIYVGATSVLYEIDPTTLTVRNQMVVDGTPDQLQFTPDGTKAVAINRTVTGSWAILLDLKNHGSLGTLPNFLGDAPDHVIIAGNDRLYATSTNTRNLYRIDLNPLAIRLAAFENVGNVNGVISAVATNQVPLAKYLFLSDANNIYRADLSTGNIDGTSPLSSTPGPLLYIGPANTATSVSAVQYNDNQTIAGGAVSAPLVIRAMDANGKAVYNVPVVWTAAGGATLSAANSVTNMDGLAETAVTAPAVSGPFQVTARIGVSGQILATFTLTSGSGGTGNTAGISIYSGNGQIVWSTTKSDYPLTVQVLDSAGNAVPGITVTWSAADGNGGPSVPTSVTDQNGLAIANFNSGYIDATFYSFAKSHVTASAADYGAVTFVATTVPMTLTSGSAAFPTLVLINPPSTNRTLQGKLGQTLSGALMAQAIVASGFQTGTSLSDVGLFILQDASRMDPTTGPVANCRGGTALSGPDGTATCDVVIGGTVGTRAIRVQFGGASGWDVVLTASIGDPGKIAIISGSGQSGSPGQTLPVTLVGEVSDGYGNLLPGTAVTWDVVPPTAATLKNAVTTADANGRVSARVLLGSNAGTFQVRARTTTGTGQALFSETVSITLAAPTKVSGDTPVQSALLNQAFALPLVIQVNDTTGKPASNIGVAWAVATGSATLSSTVLNTNAQGQASTNVTAGSTAGTITVTATIGSTVLTFTLGSRLPGPVVAATDFFNGAGFQPGVTPGGIVSIRGKGLATGLNGLVVANSIIGPMPYSLAGVTVTFGNTPAPIYHVANLNGIEQVTVQAPFELTGPGTTAVTITVNGAPTVVNVPVLAYQPGIFETMDDNGNRYAVLLHPNGSYVTRGTPAQPGEILRMFVTGLGQTSPATGTGWAGEPGQAVLVPLLLGVNNGGARIVSAEYMVGAVGVYIVTFQVPSDVPTGTSRPLALAVISPDGTTATFGNPSNFAVQQ